MMHDHEVSTVYTAYIQPPDVPHDHLGVHRARKELRRYKRVAKVLICDDDDQIVRWEARKLNVDYTPLRSKFDELCITQMSKIRDKKCDTVLPSPRKGRCRNVCKPR